MPEKLGSYLLGGDVKRLKGPSRVGRTRATPVLSLVMLVMLPSWFPAAVAEAETTKHLRLGALDFQEYDGPVREHPSLIALTRYLRKVQQADAGYTFDLAVGNYYQLYSWLQSGELDGALVSPATAMLLREQFAPVASFREWAPGAESGRARGLLPDGTEEYRVPVLELKGEEPPQSPVEAYLRHVDGLVARATGARAAVDSKCEVGFVTHLSTTGFVLPMAWTASLVGQRGLSEEHATEFWRHFLGGICFRGIHGEAGGESYRFEFGSKPPSQMAGLAATSNNNLGYGTRALERYLPIEVARDVLILRRDLLRASDDLVWVAGYGPLGVEGRAVSASDHISYDLAVRPPPEDAPVLPSDYRSIRAWADLASRVSVLEEAPGLRSRLLSWYGHGNYEFTVGEVVQLLVREQQMRQSSALALVLPGGGVRSAYQARTLDEFYGRGYLQNGASGSPLGQTLRVAAIAGTSGGALNGALAAQDYSVDRPISDEWSGLHHRSVFPFFGLLRWASLALVLLIFALWIFAAATPGWLPNAEGGANEARIHWGYPVGALALTLVHAWIHGPGFWDDEVSSESLDWTLFALRLVILLGVHFVLTAMASGTVDQARRWTTVWWLAAVLAVVGVTSIYARHQAVEADADAGVVLVELVLVAPVLAAFVAALAGRVKLRPEHPYLYACALTGLASYAVVTGVIVAVCWRYSDASFELVSEYWSTLVWTAAFVAVVFSVLLKKVPLPEFLRRGFGFFRQEQVFAIIKLRPATVMLIGVTASMISWGVAVASALYDNDVAHDLFHAKLLKRARPDGGIDVKTPLVVSLTTMGVGRLCESDGECGSGGAVQAWQDRPIYLCYSTDDGDACAHTGHADLFRVEPGDAMHWVDPIFASGSPFPILGPMKIRGLPVRSSRHPGKLYLHGVFVDGGFAHNTPLHAASIVGAKQVLVLRSAPPPHAFEDDGGIEVGRLASGLTRMFGFLFDLSQEIDRQSASRLFVASVGPPEGSAEVFLGDFRRSTIEELLRAADRDMGRRVGRIESWGAPNVHLRLKWVP